MGGESVPFTHPHSRYDIPDERTEAERKKESLFSSVRLQKMILDSRASNEMMEKAVTSTVAFTVQLCMRKLKKIKN